MACGGEAGRFSRWPTWGLVKKLVLGLYLALRSLSSYFVGSAL